MNPASQRARKIIEHLTIQWVRGWQAYFVAKHIHEWIKNNRISSMFHLFNTVELSCEETTLLTLSKLLSKQDDSVTVLYLINYAEQNSHIFPKATVPNMRNIAFRNREHLDLLTPIMENIKSHRDKKIAHLDKQHLNASPSVANMPSLNYYEIEKAFGLLRDILNEYGSTLEPPFAPALPTTKPDVIADLEYLTQLIEQESAKNNSEIQCQGMTGQKSPTKRI